MSDVLAAANDAGGLFALRLADGEQIWHTPAPKLEWLTEQVEFIASQRNAGRTTYVHCYAGVSRSVMVVAAYLIHKHGWTRDEALAHIRERRPQVRPNPAFMDLLEEWERVVKKRRGD